MATYVPAKRATACRFTLSLFARSDNQIKTAPTLASGDVKVSKDNGATANITTLPSEAPASSGILQVDLSATEMTADLVTVIFRDAAGAEWNDVAVHIATAARQIDDLAFPNTSGRGMDVDASGGVEVGSFQAGAITAAAIATGAIDADAIATDAVTEIQSGLATAAALAVVDDFLDTEIAAIITAIDALPTNAELATALAAADDAVLAAIAALSIPTANENADALLDRANAIETGLTVRNSLRLLSAVMAGKASGGGTGTETFRNAIADNKDRLISSNDSSGNRTAITVDLS